MSLVIRDADFWEKIHQERDEHCETAGIPTGRLSKGGKEPDEELASLSGYLKERGGFLPLEGDADAWTPHQTPTNTILAENCLPGNIGHCE